ncbi:nitrile hydratase accessory protein [Cognatishimia sp.]|uniref:nitrile hydratase accessory protein n=1 Tax=Cognatishimia sp. TaxID=2211648 RepID=UPI003512B7D2
MSQPDPAFEAPWHAELFALTVAMNEAGHFSWAEWVQVFSSQLKQDGLKAELNGGDDYFNAWLTALEGLLTKGGFAEARVLQDLKQAWSAAYLATPHGQPVRLKDAC